VSVASQIKLFLGRHSLVAREGDLWCGALNASPCPSPSNAAMPCRRETLRAEEWAGFSGLCSNRPCRASNSFHPVNCIISKANLNITPAFPSFPPGRMHFQDGFFVPLVVRLS